MDSDELIGRSIPGPEGDGRAERELDRLVAFSDGVMAIAITLLVLKVDTPDFAENASDTQLSSAVIDLLPNILTFIWSFLVVARFWVVHRRLFSGLVRTDTSLNVLNIVFLLLIALLPFPSDLLGTYGPSTLTIALFAGLIALTGFVSVGMGQYAYRQPRLVSPTVNLTEAEQDVFDQLITPVVFLLSIAVAVFNADLALYTWLLLFLRPLRQRRRQVSRARANPGGR